MNALDLITPGIPALKPSDDIGRALAWMEDLKVSHLPVVENKRLVGLVTDRGLVDRNDPLALVGSVMEQVEVPFVRSEQHILELMKFFSKRGLSVVPVLDEMGLYLGSINEHAALCKLAEVTNLHEPGSLVILEMNQNDYSLEEIARIVEGNNAKVLSLHSHSLPDSNRLEVILKINHEDVSGILRTFERYDYQVRSTFQDTQMRDNLKERYDELMRYINL